MSDASGRKREVRYLHERDGRLYARLVVPEGLRSILGKRELVASLGADRREALRKLEAVVAGFKAQIDEAHEALIARKLMPSPAELAQRYLEDRLELDEAARDATPSWAGVGVDPGHVKAIRAAISGAATDDELEDLFGEALKNYRKRRLTTLTRDDLDWRRQMRLLARAEYVALEMSVERDDGIYRPAPPLELEGPAPGPAPRLEPEAPPAPAVKPVPLMDLFRNHVSALKRAGRGREVEHRWHPVINELVGFLGHDDAARLTKADLVRWRDHLLSRPENPLAPKTVRDVHLAAVKAILATAHGDGALGENVAKSVSVKVAKAQRSREKGYRDDEAEAVLRAAFGYRSPVDERGRLREDPRIEAAKRWAPWLCALTGARIVEVVQVRKEDVQERDGTHFLRITPDAGSVKTGTYRDVPIHRQLIELGFLKFVEAAPDGPLFTSAADTPAIALSRAKTVAGRVSMWVSSLKLAPASVAPNHGWRHRFKTVARELGCDPRVVDAIQGHAARTAGDDYGDVTLKAKAIVIDKLPSYRT